MVEIYKSLTLVLLAVMDILVAVWF